MNQPNYQKELEKILSGIEGRGDGAPRLLMIIPVKE